MLRASSLVLLAGCHLAFGLERPGHDEDGDGTPDEVDPCPHLPTVTMDTDGDGIGDACDPSDQQEVAHLFTFHEDTEGLLVNGSARVDGDDLVFGSPDEATSTIFLLGDDAQVARVDTAWIDVAFTIVDPQPDGEYHETGITFGNVTTADKERGDVCFAGFEGGTPGRQLSTYLEMVENEVEQNKNTVSTPILGNRATLTGSWTKTEHRCTLTAPGIRLDDRYVPTLGAGRLGIYQQRARARLHYLWIVTRP